MFPSSHHCTATATAICCDVEPAHPLLADALTDLRVIARYEAKIIHPETQECHFWFSALHARTEHDRFFIGTTAQR